jgi:hypothetical protein
MGVLTFFLAIALSTSPAFAQITYCVNSSYRATEWDFNDSLTGLTHGFTTPKFCNYGCDATANDCSPDPFLVVLGIGGFFVIIFVILFWAVKKSKGR